MTIRFELPGEIEQQLRENGADLSREAKESFLVELYRQERISHNQLAEALGLSRYEADGVLKRHGVELELTLEEFRSRGRFAPGGEAGMIVVSDTSPLHDLVLIGSVDVLPRLFDRVVIPPAVSREMR